VATKLSENFDGETRLLQFANNKRQSSFTLRCRVSIGYSGRRTGRRLAPHLEGFALSFCTDLL